MIPYVEVSIKSNLETPESFLSVEIKSLTEIDNWKYRTFQIQY